MINLCGRNNVLAGFWLLNAPIQEIAEFCKNYGYEVTILGTNNYILERKLGR